MNGTLPSVEVSMFESDRYINEQFCRVDKLKHHRIRLKENRLAKMGKKTSFVLVFSYQFFSLIHDVIES